MQRFWTSVAVTLGKRSGLVAVIGLAVTLILGLGATRLEFATGQDSYLNEGEQIAVDNEAYQSRFGGQAVLTLFTMNEGSDVVDLFTESNLAQLDEIEQRLTSTDGVLAVVTPRTALEFTQSLVTSPTGNPTESVAGRILLGARGRDPDPQSQATRLADAAKTLERLSAVPEGQRNFDNPEWVRFLLFDNRGEIRKSLRPFFPDERHAQLVTRLTGNADVEQEGAASEAILEVMQGREFENATVLTTGASILLKDLNDYLKGGFLSLGGIAVLLMVVVLVLAFPVRWRLLPLAVVLIGVIWAFGLAGYLGIPLSVVTISGLPVLLGVGIDFAIQLHSRVEEEVVVDHELHPIQRALLGVGPAIIVATLAAAVAFLALLFARVPMIRHFGVLLAVGIIVVAIADVVLTTAVLGAREYRSPTKRDDYRTGFLSRAVIWLGSLPLKIVPVVLAASVVIFAVGVVADSGLELQTDPEEWVDQDSQVVQDLDRLRAETGSSSELGIFVQSDDIFSDETVAFVHETATSKLDQYPERLLTASSIVTTVSFLMEMPNTTEIVPTGEEVRAAWDAAPEAIKRSTISESGDALNLIFRTGPGSLKQRAVVVNEIRDSLDPPPGITATPSGLAVVGVGLLDNLEKNRSVLTYIALGGVLVFLGLRFRSVVRALLCAVPVLIAVGLSALVASLAGFKLSPLTAVGGPLVIAACTEFTALILMRYLEERSVGHAPEEASNVAASRTGRAFVASALATAIGVGVLATSSLPLLRDFGLIVAINVAVALLAALVILPPIMVWADKRGWVTGKQVASSPRSGAVGAQRPAT